MTTVLRPAGSLPLSEPAALFDPALAETTRLDAHTSLRQREMALLLQ